MFTFNSVTSILHCCGINAAQQKLQTSYLVKAFHYTVTPYIPAMLGGTQFHSDVHGCQLCHQISKHIGHRDNLNLTSVTADLAFPPSGGGALGECGVGSS